MAHLDISSAPSCRCCSCLFRLLFHCLKLSFVPFMLNHGSSVTSEWWCLFHKHPDFRLLLMQNSPINPYLGREQWERAGLPLSTLFHWCVTNYASASLEEDTASTVTSCQKWLGYLQIQWIPGTVTSGYSAEPIFYVHKSTRLCWQLGHFDIFILYLISLSNKIPPYHNLLHTLENNLLHLSFDLMHKMMVSLLSKGYFQNFGCSQQLFVGWTGLFLFISIMIQFLNCASKARQACAECLFTLSCTAENQYHWL